MKSLSNNKVSVQSLNGQSASRIISDNSTQIDQEIHDRKAADAQLQSEIDDLGEILNNGLPFDPNIVPVSDNNGNLTSSLVTNLELNTLLGNTLNIHDEFEALDDRVSDVEAQITQQTPNRAIISDGTGALTSSVVTSTELSNVSGSTANIQGQLNGLDGRVTNVESDVSNIEYDLTNKYDKTGGTINGNVLLPADRWLNFHDIVRGICSKSGTNGNIFFRNVYAAGQHTSQGLFIWENGGHNSITEKMRLNGYGNLGIGTDSPQEKLHVSGTIRSESLSANTALIADGTKNLVSSSVTVTELAQLVGVTSPVQTQLDGLDTRLVSTETALNGKLNKSGDTMTGTLVLTNGGSSRRGNLVFGNSPHSIYRDDNNDLIIENAGANLSEGSLIFKSGSSSSRSELFRVNRSGTIRSEALSANTALIADGSKNLVSSAVSVTELSQLVGVTSPIQDQLDSKATSYDFTDMYTDFGPPGISSGPVLSDDYGRINFNGTGAATLKQLDISVPTASGSTRHAAIRMFHNSYGTGGSSLRLYGPVSGSTTRMDIFFAPGDRAYFMNTDVGIGVLSPAERLHVDGNAIITGSVRSDALTADRVLVSNASKNIVHSTIPTNYISTLTGPVQTQLDNLVTKDNDQQLEIDDLGEHSVRAKNDVYPGLLSSIDTTNSSGSLTINFLGYFSFRPVVTATCVDATTSNQRVVHITSLSVSSVTFRVTAANGSGSQSTVSWIATGPRAL